ncbi:hypothetical protein GLAREA_11702 [Glarea lozoyensis ATCC 20868]|uniref:Uncharacterized protein n=1 Tax=Glarea lozoyensis (strain ATCC 20868 / MF5171) TaxID=1116229 RepID=S3CZ47_GLAL2|nr:uncharacterized protein GLAREA_11702 [Glarea lozoyensis ATCC 20868]EPE25121.1 hypothetical protein GLAREA_11702 [Glarea lozoyensis ATCC 20868]
MDENPKTLRDATDKDQEPASSFKFIHLPPEIRDHIYTLALSSPSPIVVWKGKWGFLSRPPDSSYTTVIDVVKRSMATDALWIDASITKTCLTKYSTNLFYCNKKLGGEAVKVFYRKNVFAFVGDHNWDYILSWLFKINERNRSYLSRLEIDACRPEEVWQSANGERKSGLDLFKDPIFPRSPHLQFRTPLKYGWVENISPTVEIIFELLGKKRSSQLAIDFKLSTDYPGQGMVFRVDDHYPQQGWCGMDLPNLIEKFRSLYSTPLQKLGSSKPLIDVIWTGKCPTVIVEREYKKYSRTTIEDHMENIAARGWEIKLSPMEEEHWEWGLCNSYDDEDDLEEKHIPTFVLRKKLLEEPLLGDDPNPYSGAGEPFTAEERELERTNHYYDQAIPPSTFVKYPPYGVF